MRKATILLWIILFMIPQFAAKADDVSEEIEAIQKKIKEKGLDWVAGYNEIMDLPLKERRMRLGLTEPPEEIRRAYEKLNSLPPPELLNTEDYFDWRLRSEEHTSELQSH